MIRMRAPKMTNRMFCRFECFHNMGCGRVDRIDTAIRPSSDGKEDAGNIMMPFALIGDQCPGIT